jgi:DNA-directed RNA polymerase subunit L
MVSVAKRVKDKLIYSIYITALQQTDMDIVLEDSTPALVNTIRRIVFESIPHFGFPPEKIHIRRNTTCLHNDQVKERISNMPVMGLRNDKATYQRYWNECGILKVVQGLLSDDECIDADVSSEPTLGVDVLSFRVKVEHRDPQVQFVNVTTNDCDFSVNGLSVPNPYVEGSILLCRLRLGEDIDFSAESEMNIPSVHPRYNPVDNCYFVELGEGKHRLFLEPRPGITGKEIIERARDILLRKVDYLKAKVKQSGQESNEKKTKKGYTVSGTIDVKNDRFTIPEIVTHYLMKHESISYAGYKCDHLLNRASTISYSSNQDISKVLDDVSKNIEQDTKNSWLKPLSKMKV